MTKKTVKPVANRMCLGDLYKAESRIIGKIEGNMGVLTNEFRAGTARCHDLVNKIGGVLVGNGETLGEMAKVVKVMSDNQTAAHEAILKEMRDFLAKETQDSATEVIKQHRALTHFSWEKLAETQDALISAQNTATRRVFLFVTVQTVILIGVFALKWILFP